MHKMWWINCALSGNKCCCSFDSDVASFCNAFWVMIKSKKNRYYTLLKLAEVKLYKTYSTVYTETICQN